jgi:hypothetical protein
MGAKDNSPDARPWASMTEGFDQQENWDGEKKQGLGPGTK